MKRNYILVFIVCIIQLIISGCSTVSSGPMATEDEKQFEKIIEVSGKTKDELYVNANTWFVDTFNSAGSVIQYQDKEAGRIMGKYSLNYTEGMYQYNVKSTLALDIKDGKARVKIYDPVYAIIGDSLNGTYPRAAVYSGNFSVKGIQKTKEEWKLLVQSLEESLKTESSW